MWKTDVEFSTNGEEITHSVYREFYFEHSVSNGSDEDTVIVPNIPLFGLIKSMTGKSSTEKQIAKDLLESYKSEGMDTVPFIKVTIKDLFWGYPSILLSMGRQQDSSIICGASTEERDLFAMFDNGENSDGIEDGVNCDIKAGNLVPFGVFTTRNATSVDSRTVKTGKQ
jgi:hypothetical protein